MPVSSNIKHIIFDEFSELDEYFRDNKEIKAISKGKRSLARIEYRSGKYKNCYVVVFLVLPDLIELDIPRAVIKKKDCTVEEAQKLERYGIIPSDDSGLVAMPTDVKDYELAEHKPFDSLDELLGYYGAHATGEYKEDWDLVRIDYGDDELQDFPDSYVFLAYDLKKGEELDLARGVLHREGLSTEEVEEIENMEPFSYDEETIETSVEESEEAEFSFEEDDGSDSQDEDEDDSEEEDSTKKKKPIVFN